jgi:transcriptional regulator with XRE-family HTH domain
MRRANEDPEFKQAVGRRLRELRAAKDWTLADVERRSGDQIARTRLNNYERGIRLPSQAEAEVLGVPFDVPASYILRLDEDMHPLNKIERQLIKDFRVLPEGERMAYARRIGSLAATYRDPVPDETVSRFLPAPERADQAPGKK